MRLVSIKRLRPGSLLGRDVPHASGGPVPLLRAGSELTDAYIGALEREGVHAVYVDDKASAGIVVEDPLREETRREADHAVRKLFAPEAGIAAGGERLPEELLEQLARVAGMIAGDIAGSQAAIYAFTDLSTADAYTFRHSIDVTVVGLLIARKLFEERGWTDYRGKRRFERVDEKLSRLGLGLLLHDVGKLAIPQAVLRKPGALTVDEWELVRHHPLAGLDILDCELISPLVKGVVRSHHERWDGSGYPDRRAGGDIFHFARVAAVADVYDAVTSDRPYCDGSAAHVGVAEVRSGRGTAFDPEVVQIFNEVVAPFPPATEITLRDGSAGVVAAVEPGHLDYPRVRVTHAPDGSEVQPYEVELRERPELAPPIVPQRPAGVAA